MYIPPKHMKIGVFFTKVNDLSFVIHLFPNLLAIQANSYIFEIFCKILKCVVVQTKLFGLTSFIISLFCDGLLKLHILNLISPRVQYDVNQTYKIWVALVCLALE